MIRRLRDRRGRRRRVRVTLDSVRIGQRIRAARTRIDMRVVDLASVTGLSAYRAWQLDAGREVPTLAEAVVISGALYRSLEWILLGAPRRALLWKFLNPAIVWSPASDRPRREQEARGRPAPPRKNAEW